MPMIGRRPVARAADAGEGVGGLSRCCDWSDADYAANGAMIGSRDAIQSHGRSVSCAFRRSRPLIPIETDHPFRMKPAGDSGEVSQGGDRTASQ